MLEASRGYESSYLSESAGSKRFQATDLYQNDSAEKMRSPESNLRYDNLKNSEMEISSHLDRVHQLQHDRLMEGANTNAFYKRELENLRSNLANTRSKVRSNHFPEDDYLLESTKEKIRSMQYGRERELRERFGEEPQASYDYYGSQAESGEKSKIKVRQSQREEELDKEYQVNEGGVMPSDRFKESVGSQKTYDLSNSVRSNDYKERINEGLSNLENKMNLMERELDDHLSQKNREYYTNKDLVKEKQRQRELELIRQKQLAQDEGVEEEDEEDQIMESMQEKERSQKDTSTRDIQFKDAFDRREQKLRKESEDIERDIARRTLSNAEVEEQELSPGQSPGYEDPQEAEFHRRRAFEDELEELKEENRKIRHELLTIQKSQDMRTRHGDVKLHAANTVIREEPNRSTLKRTNVIRVPAKYDSNKAIDDYTREDDIKKTVTKARREVQEKLHRNIHQGSKSLNKKTESQKKATFLGVRNELYNKYYGYPAHLKEATYFLSKGLPTTYMSDSKREVPQKDPKKTLPKKFEKALKY